jgi:ABC-type Zn uptake system ZnuABC Zn-binding protein ZnuA
MNQRCERRNAMSPATRQWIKLCLLLIILIAVSVGPSPAADKIKAVATFSVIGNMVTTVMGDRVELSTLVGPNGDSSTSQLWLMAVRLPMRACCS